MNIPPEVIIEILVRQKLEGSCTCSRHRLDFYTSFSNLIAEYVERQIINRMYFDGYEHYILRKEDFDALFGEKNETV